MNIFPTITCLDDLMPHIESHKEIKVMRQENGTQVVCYIVAGDETFDNEFTRECRGITFDKDGKIISRPLHKFFNVNERESTQAHVLPWNTVTRVMDKRDGSMIIPVLVDGKVQIKTKKSFTSDVAKVAQKFFDDDRSDLMTGVVELLTSNFTPIFEYTSPTNRIVLPYEKDEMTLLHVRDNVSGRYFTEKEMRSFASQFNIKLVETMQLSDIPKFLETAKDVKGIEGWVIQFSSGEMVKLKTEEYLISHRLITFVRERDIAEMVLDETLDDVKSAMLERNISLDKLHAVEHRVIQILGQLEDEVEAFFHSYKTLSRKDYAEKAKEYKTFGLMMQMYSGQEPKYVDFFKKTILKEQFDLTSV